MLCSPKAKVIYRRRKSKKNKSKRLGKTLDKKRKMCSGISFIDLAAKDELGGEKYLFEPPERPLIGVLVSHNPFSTQLTCFWWCVREGV